MPYHGLLLRQLAQNMTQLRALTTKTPDDDVMLQAHLLLVTLAQVALCRVALHGPLFVSALLSCGWTAGL